MQIKRFEAQTMQEALSMVKKEFGPEAVILSARSIKNNRGIYRFLNRPGVEVTAAIDSMDSSTTNKRRKAKKDQISMDHAGQEQKDFSPARAGVRFLQDNKTGIEEHINSPRHGAVRNTTLLSITYKHMLTQGVMPELAGKLVEHMKGNPLVTEHSSVHDLRTGLITAFIDLGIRENPIHLNDGKKRIIALVGAPGVGKTTTIAKIAANYSLDLRTKVALVTVDDYRIAAIEQLKIYGRIIGLPVEVASSSRELKKVIKKLGSADLVIVDTPGISQKDLERLDELRLILNGIKDMEIHIVASATTKEEDMRETIDRFSILSIDNLLFTKLDDTMTYGAILNEIYRTGLPVSFLTNGQNVPEDIIMNPLETMAGLMVKMEDRPARACERGTPGDVGEEPDRLSMTGYGDRTAFLYHSRLP